MRHSLTRSKVELFLQCPRCFWLDAVAGVRQPPGNRKNPLEKAPRP